MWAEWQPSTPLARLIAPLVTRARIESALEKCGGKWCKSGKERENRNVSYRTVTEREDIGLGTRRKK